MTILHHGYGAPSAPLSQLDERARDIFRRVVETYLDTGEPVGSRTVSKGGLQHVEFVSLGPDEALAVMVFDDGAIENRLMRLAPGLTPSALQEASNFLNARLAGLDQGA